MAFYPLGESLFGRCPPVALVGLRDLGDFPSWLLQKAVPRVVIEYFLFPAVDVYHLSGLVPCLPGYCPIALFVARGFRDEAGPKAMSREVERFQARLFLQLMDNPGYVSAINGAPCHIPALGDALEDVPFLDAGGLYPFPKGPDGAKGLFPGVEDRLQLAFPFLVCLGSGNPDKQPSSLLFNVFNPEGYQFRTPESPGEPDQNQGTVPGAAASISFVMACVRLNFSPCPYNKTLSDLFCGIFYSLSCRRIPRLVSAPVASCTFEFYGAFPPATVTLFLEMFGNILEVAPLAVDPCPTFRALEHGAFKLRL